MARVLPLPALRLFSPLEFNQLLSGGADGGIDLDDWKGTRERGSGEAGAQGRPYARAHKGARAWLGAPTRAPLLGK